MKIAHVTTIATSLEGLLLNQMKSLQAAGYEVAGISAPDKSVAVLEAAGIRHHAVPMSRNFTPFADLNSLWQLWRVMRRERFSIIHTHTPKAGLLGQLAARLAGVPVIVNTVHGFYFHDHMPARSRRFYITMEKVAALCSHHILSQNAEDIRTAIREGICKEKDIEFLGNGIDLTAYEPARFTEDDLRAARSRFSIPSGAPIVGFCGRLAAKRKGFLDFLRAAADIAKQKPDTRFLIIGEADHGKPDAVEPSVAGEFGIADKCVFAGQRPNSELPVLYKIMDVLVLPSLFEGVPRVIMEASAMGTPAVASDVKGNREAVEDGVSGLLVPYADVPALSNAILRILNEPATAASMSAGCLRLAAGRFDERIVFEKVRNAYARLLAAKSIAIPRPAAAAPVRAETARA